MFSAQRNHLAGIAMLAALSWHPHATAEGLFHATPAPAVSIVKPTAFASLERLAPASSDASRRSPFGSAPMPAAALANKRGGERVFNDAQLKGTVADNSATNVATGTNTISDGAFSGSAGLSTVIQNSGNNVLIQNATIVNVQMK
jgi:hypothetical protein